MAPKIDPLNRNNYAAVSVLLTVTDIKEAMSFYQKAFGFKKKSTLKGPDGKLIHAELHLRGTALMLGPEMPGWTKSAQTLGGSPISLYLLVEDADRVFAQALELGAVAKMPMSDMFWGDRCGSLTDPQGIVWSVARHVSAPTPRELTKRMKAQMESWASS